VDQDVDGVAVDELLAGRAEADVGALGGEQRGERGG
jgi:hypothetical protein